MVQQTKERATNSTEVAEDTQLKAAQAAGQAVMDRIAEDIDDILADIDDVLETNAEEFVDNFVQKGGQ